MKLEHLSASRIKTFQQCQMRYFATYELGVKEVVHPLTDLGSACHLMLELAVKARMAGGAGGEACDPRTHKKAAMDEFKVDRSYSGLIDELMGNAEKWGYFRNVARTAGCEVEFDLELPDGTKVQGFIDRLDLLPPCADVVDIKTQKAMFTDEELRGNWQARIYNMAARRRYPEVTGKVSVSFWVLRHMVQRVWLTSHDAEAVVADLMDVAREIRGCRSPEARPSALCRYCGYRHECPAAEVGGEPRRKSWARAMARRRR
jgi:RecB family exonuclease